jgi:hypothetical protein
MWLVANVSSGQVFSPDLTPTARRRGLFLTSELGRTEGEERERKKR